MGQFGQRKKTIRLLEIGFFKVQLGAILFAFLLQTPFGFNVVQSANAQEKEPPQTLFRLLFGETEKRQPAPKPQAPPASKGKQQRAGTVVQRAPTVATEPELTAVEKTENAKRILVVGDFTAGATAKGLQASYEQVANVIILDAANGSSGLVRDDFYDWNTELPALITEQKPDIVVMMIGANDRQQLLVSGKRESVRSDAWIAEYRARVHQLTTLVTLKDIPLVWIGQVPYSASTMMSDMLLFNDIYRDITGEIDDAHYVDVWEGFVDENGKFVSRGPDINGQIVALRSGSVNLTKAGARKVAFYAERTLQELIGEDNAPVTFQLGAENLPVLSLNGPGVNNAIIRIRPVAINSTTLDGGDELLGANIVANQPASIALKPVTGRINDFAIAPQMGPPMSSEAN